MTRPLKIGNQLPGPPFVAVVDDDESVRESFPDLLKTYGLLSQGFSSAGEFLSSDLVYRTDCLVLDVAMPGMSGPALQQELSRRGKAIPIVFVTALADEDLRPQMLAAGAVDCLVKPVSETVLLEAISAALRPRGVADTKV